MSSVSPWFLVAKVDRAEALAAWRFAGATILALVLAGWCCLSCAMLALWQRNAKGHFRTRFEAEAAQRRAEAGHRIILQSIGDAVIVTDAGGRVGVLNPAAEVLTGWKQDEARRRPLHEVFRIIDEVTRQPGDNPVDRVLREGVVVGLANQTLLVARDGTERPIADSGAPIRDEVGRIAGVVLVFRDQTKERLAGRALRESRELLEAVVEGSSDPIYLKDHEGRYRVFNSAAAHVVGKAAAEVLGKDDRAIFPPDEAQAVMAGDRAVMVGGVAKTYDECVTGADGRRRHFLSTKGPLRDGDDQVIGIWGVAHDITQRKEAEEVVRVERQRLYTVLDTLPALICVLTAEHHVAFANRLFREKFGEARGRRCFEYCFGRTEPCPFCEAFDVLRTGQPHHWQVTLPDGTLLDAHDYPFTDTDGSSMILEMDIDITARQRAEDQLKILARVVEQSPASIMLTDRAGNIEFVNPRFTQITGYAVAEVLGRNPRFLKSGETPAQEYRRLWETIAAGGEWRGEFHNKRKDGTLYWETAAISPLRDAHGRIAHFMAIKEDVTEHKLTQAKLLRVQRVESIGALAGGIAHDLNNILAPIVMCAPMLQSDALPGDLREIARTIESSARRGVAVVRQLLGFARGKGGQRQSVQLGHLVREMAQLARETFPRNLKFEETCASDLWPVWADATQLQQVILNLCINARDAMPGGGSLSLRAANVTLDPHFAALPKEVASGPFVRLQVEDTGSGIPDELRGRIFESFFTTKGDGQGTGLGLTTVQGIVRDHKGFVTFTSALGRGTTFEIHLPAVPADAVAVRPA